MRDARTLSRRFNARLWFAKSRETSALATSSSLAVSRILLTASW